MHAIGRAILAGEVGGARGDHDVHLLPFARKILHREGDGGIAEAEDGVHLLLVVPAPRDRHADIGAVLQIAEDELDRHAEDAAAEILDGEARADDIAHALLIGEDAGHVVQHAELDHAVRDALGGGAARQQADKGQRAGAGEQGPAVHCLPPGRLAPASLVRARGGWRAATG